jgi:phosphonate transport system substrate-binding protein
MISKTPVLSLCCLALLCVAGNFTVPVAAQTRAEPSSVVIALRPDKDPDQMLAERRRLEAFLSERLGMPVTTQVPTLNAVIIEGLANGTIDLAFLPASAMVPARDRGLAKVLLAGELDGKTYYESYWLVRADSPYQTLEDLRGKPIAFASRTSTSGYVVPLYGLYQRGLVGEDADASRFFGRDNIFFGIGYVSAVERVLRGQAEAAAVSDYVFNRDRHLTSEQRAQLRVLDRHAPVPTHVIAVRASLPEAFQARLREALLSLNEPENHNLRDMLFTGPQVVVDETEHLAPIAAALEFASRAPVR